MSTAQAHNLSGSLPAPFGRYELIRRIGSGGMGEVFLARDLRQTQRICVVKKVLPHLVNNPNFVRRFLDEAKVVVNLVHPNVVRIFDLGECEGQFFLAMEYVQGRTVSKLMRRLRDAGRALTPAEIIYLGEQVCRGLDYAHDAVDADGHELMLVHRDMSPANVCVSYEGDVKIIDFGAAQSVLKESQTAPKVVIGNLAYMAPEQALKKPVDRRADIYACGAMLWELLAWQTLPQRGDPIERWRKAVQAQWPAPSSLRSEVPLALDGIVLKALAKNPNLRHATARDLGDELRAMLRPAEIADARKSLAETLSRAFSKERVLENALMLQLRERAEPPDELREETIKLLLPPTAMAFERALGSGLKQVARPSAPQPVYAQSGQDEEEDFVPTLAHAIASLPSGPTPAGPSRWKMWAVAGAVFLVAAAAGFAAIMLFGKR